MDYERLRQVEKSLKRLREQLANKEDTLVTIEPAEKVRIRQQIDDLKPQIKDFEQEYWQILASGSAELAVDEPEAEILVAEIVQEVGKLEVQQPAYPEEMLQILRQIRDKLNEPEPLAAAKLKGVVSSMPPFVGVSYEAEIDTENFLRRHFPTFRGWIEAAKKK